MASIRRDILIHARPEDVWAAIRDVGAIHERLAPGFVVLLPDCRGPYTSTAGTDPSNRRSGVEALRGMNFMGCIVEA